MTDGDHARSEPNASGDPPDRGSWKERLLDGYVSTGCSGPAGQEMADPEDLDALLRARRPWIERTVDQFVPADREARILDLGCGHGAFVRVLREHGYRRVEGVDASREQVELAERLGVDGVVLADALQYLRELEAGCREVILAIDLLEHLDRPTALELTLEARRVLAEGGRMVLHVPNGTGLFGAGVRWGDLTHETAYTQGSVRQLLRSAGFGRIEVHSDPPAVHGVASLLRRIVWSAGTVPLRLLYAAETGDLSTVLTRNLFATARP